MYLEPKVVKDKESAHAPSSLNQYNSKLATLPDGSFMVIWSHRDGDLQASFSMYASDGSVIYQGQPLSQTIQNSSHSLVDVGVVDNQYVILWQGKSSSSSSNSSVDYNIYATLLDQSGQVVNAKTLFATFDNGIRFVSLENTNAGGLVAGYSNWSSSSNGGRDDWDVAGATYTLSGSTLSKSVGETILNSSLPENQEAAHVVQLTDGYYAAAWGSDVGNGVASSGVYMRLLDANFKPVGSDTRIDNNYSDTSYTSGERIVALKNGGFAVVWQQRKSAIEGYEEYWARGGYHIEFAVFNSDGTVKSTAGRINGGKVLDEFNPQITELTDGRFIVVWNSLATESDPWTIRGVYMNEEFAVIGDSFELAQYNETSPIYTDPMVEALPNGGFILAWSDESTPTSDGDKDVYYKTFGSAEVTPSQNVLARLPDSTTPVSLSNDTVALHVVDSNGNNQQDYNEGLVVNGDLFVDAEAVQLIRLYSASLGRSPDRDGFEYWQGQASQKSIERIADEFFWSSEMQGQMDKDKSGAVSDSEFIDHLYQNVLGREADQGGEAYWLGRLNEGTDKGQALAEFLNGTEFVSQTQTLVGQFAEDNVGFWM